MARGAEGPNVDGPNSTEEGCFGEHGAPAGDEVSWERCRREIREDIDSIRDDIDNTLDEKIKGIEDTLEKKIEDTLEKKIKDVLREEVKDVLKEEIKRMLDESILAFGSGLLNPSYAGRDSRPLKHREVPAKPSKLSQARRGAGKTRKGDSGGVGGGAGGGPSARPRTGKDGRASHPADGEPPIINGNLKADQEAALQWFAARWDRRAPNIPVRMRVHRGRAKVTLVWPTLTTGPSGTTVDDVIEEALNGVGACPALLGLYEQGGADFVSARDVTTLAIIRIGQFFWGKPWTDVDLCHADLVKSSGSKRYQLDDIIEWIDRAERKAAKRKRFADEPAAGRKKRTPLPCTDPPAYKEQAHAAATGAGAARVAVEEDEAQKSVPAKRKRAPAGPKRCEPAKRATSRAKVTSDKEDAPQDGCGGPKKKAKKASKKDKAAEAQ